MSDHPDEGRFSRMVQAYKLLHEARELTTAPEERAVLDELLIALARLSRPVLANIQVAQTQKGAATDR